MIIEANPGIVEYRLTGNRSQEQKDGNFDVCWSARSRHCIVRVREDVCKPFRIRNVKWNRVEHVARIDLFRFLLGR